MAETGDGDKTLEEPARIERSSCDGCGTGDRAHLVEVDVDQRSIGANEPSAGRIERDARMIDVHGTAVGHLDDEGYERLLMNQLDHFHFDLLARHDPPGTRGS